MKWIANWAVVVALVMTVSGCAPTTRQKLLAAAKDLDHVACHIEEWGSVAISGPFISTPSEKNAFNLDLTDKELFERNRTQGAVREALLQALSVKFAAQKAVPGADGVTPTPPSLPADGKALEAVGAFTPVQEPFSGDLALSQRRRIRLTASDRAELNLHKFFSYPTGLAKGQKAYFLNFTVACIPGWRTRKGFSGNLDVRVEYSIGTEPLAEVLKSLGSLHPLVGAVYPAFDSQELDLRSSYRQMLHIAAKLATANKIAGATAFLEAAQRYEQDANTATGLAQVTSYSHGGRNFGYEFRPAFRAIATPGKRKSKPGYRLESFTFPAVAVVLVDESHLGAILTQNYAQIIQEAAKSPHLLARLIFSVTERKKPDVKAANARIAALKTRIDAVNKEISNLRGLPLPQAKGAAAERTKAIEARKELLKKMEANKEKADSDLDRIKKGFKEALDTLGAVREAHDSLRGVRETHDSLRAARDSLRDARKALDRNRTIPTEERESKVREAKAKLEKAEAKLKKAEAKLPDPEANLEQAVAKLLDDVKGEARKKVIRGLKDLVSLTFSVTHTWRPIDPPWADRWPGLEQVGRFFHKRRSQKKYAEETARLYSVAEDMKNIKDTIDSMSSSNPAEAAEAVVLENARKVLVRRYNMLQAQLNNIEPFIRFPLDDPAEPAPKMEISSVVPLTGQVGQDNTFFLIGKSLPRKLPGSNVSITIDGTTTELQARVVVPGVLLAVTVPAGAVTSPRAPLRFRLAVKGDVKKSPPIQYVAPDATAVIDKTGPGQWGSKTVLTAPKGHLDALIETQKPAPTTKPSSEQSQRRQ